MADYNSNYTGQEIDEAVEKAENAITEIPCRRAPKVGYDNQFLFVDMTVEQLRAACLQGGCVLTDQLSSYHRTYFISSFVLSDEIAECVVYGSLDFGEISVSTHVAVLHNNQDGIGCSGELFFRIVNGKPAAGWEENDLSSTVRSKLDTEYGTPFEIELTPTAQDFSGVMDKTPAEIHEAIIAGDRIIFRIPSMAATVDATLFGGGSIAFANITYDISGQDVLIQIATSASDSTYSTKIFPLTPMS